MAVKINSSPSTASFGIVSSVDQGFDFGTIGNGEKEFLEVNMLRFA